MACVPLPPLPLGVLPTGLPPPLLLPLASSASQLSSAWSTACAALARASACHRWGSSAGPGCTTSVIVATRLSRALNVMQQRESFFDNTQLVQAASGMANRWALADTEASVRTAGPPGARLCRHHPASQTPPCRSCTSARSSLMHLCCWLSPTGLLYRVHGEMKTWAAFLGPQSFSARSLMAAGDVLLEMEEPHGNF